VKTADETIQRNILKQIDQILENIKKQSLIFLCFLFELSEFIEFIEFNEYFNND